MKLLPILLLLSTLSSAQTRGFFIKAPDTLMYWSGVAGEDTIRLNKTRSAVNNIIATGTGTAYTLTATSAKVTFGTTSPTVTFLEAGTYQVTYNVRTDYVAATLAASRSISYKVRRTNNTATDLANSAKSFNSPIITLLSFSAPALTNTFFYTAVKGDIIELWGSVSVVPTAGSVQVGEANISISKVY
jgi:hypothetical protein